MKNLLKIKIQIHRSNFNKHFSLALILSFSIFAFACQTPQTTNENSSEKSKSADITPTPKIEISDFDKELKSMRVADFDYIFTLKRKDGGKFVSEDKVFVRANIHHATNRTSFIKDDTILFLGSNFPHTEENLKNLKGYFDLQDFSKPKEQIEKEKEEKRKEREANNTKTENNSSSENSNTKE